MNDKMIIDDIEINTPEEDATEHAVEMACAKTSAAAFAAFFTVTEL